ncbi:MAG: MMPL family transporter [Nitrospinae bacterium]|nr:MMPL family transporter [Nitrospinota bacterium]
MAHDIRDRIEHGFAALARWGYRHHWMALAITLLIAGGLASNLPKMTVDTSTEGFLREDDPALIEYNAFRDRFGRDEVVLVVVKAPGGEVFEKGFLETLKRLHDRLEATVPYLDEVISLVNARNTYADGDTLVVEDLLENFPQDEAGVAALKARAMENPLYRNNILSEDGTWTALVIRTLAIDPGAKGADDLSGFGDTDQALVAPPAGEPAPRKYLSDDQNNEVYRAVKETVAPFRDGGLTIALSGSPAVTTELKGAMKRDFPRFMLGAVLFIAVLLYAMFRRPSGVLFPLAVVLLSLFSTLGLMALTGVPMKMPSMILPSFILAVGVGDAVHLMSVFYRKLHDGLSREEAIVFSVGHSGLAVFLTSATTAAGLLSFLGAAIAPVAELGIFAAAGVGLALLYTLLLLPAFVAIFPVKDIPPAVDAARHARMDALLAWIARVSVLRAKTVMALFALVAAVALAGAAKITFSHDPLVWFKESAPIRHDTELVNGVMNGSVSAEVVVTLPVENGVKDPLFLAKLEGLQREMETYAAGALFVGKTMSVADIIKEIHKALNEGDPAFYAVPTDPALAAQEFILFENSGSDDLTDFVDSRFTMARFTMKMPWADAILYRPFIDHVNARFTEVFGEKASISVTGMVPLLGRTLHATIYSAAQSYVIALVIISVMMILLIGRVRIGLTSMIPNIFPIITTLGVIGWFGIPMDMYTMMFASIAIGLAVDDTIHFMHNFRRYYDRSHDVAQAVGETLHTTGRAMLTTSVVLSFGFFVLCFASLNNLFYFGSLTGLTIVVALLADFFLSPALMTLIATPNKRRKV